tara:strand:- start:1698 stop:2108 length:411 start_codon:yes stop_codon:yes gene_type:complete
MINFTSNTNFQLRHKTVLKSWIKEVVGKEGKKMKDLSFIFCDDMELLNKNSKYLNHDTLTDILTFDYSENNNISGDIYISIDRVKENAKTYKVTFENELDRVMIHGILHLLGYKDKSKKDQKAMREKEDFYLSLQT